VLLLAVLTVNPVLTAPVVPAAVLVTPLGRPVVLVLEVALALLDVLAALLAAMVLFEVAELAKPVVTVVVVVAAPDVAPTVAV